MNLDVPNGQTAAASTRSKSLLALHEETKLGPDEGAAVSRERFHAKVSSPTAGRVGVGNLNEAASAAFALDVLGLALGVSGRVPYPVRCNASSGNLHTVEARVAFAHEGGVAIGHYDPTSHTLALRGAARCDAPVSALRVALSLVLERQSAKYGARGYRYGLLDLGHALGAHVLAAHARGAHVALEDWSEEATGRAFGVSPFASAPERTGLVLRVARGPLADAPRPRCAATDSPSAVGRDARMHAWHDRTSSGHSRLREAFGAGWLPAADWRDVGPTLIRQRRSARAFTPAVLARGELDAILRPLARALGREGADVAMRAAVAAHDVHGVAPGFYALAPDGSLSALHVGDVRDDTCFMHACQQMAGDAAFVVMLGAPLAELVALRGGRAYRDAHVVAGAIGQLLCVTAESAALRGNPMGAFFDDELAPLFPAGHAPLHTLAFGVPRPRTA